MSRVVRPAQIISGGQTGADRGALDAGLELGIPIGGWAPLGWLAEDGTIPEAYRQHLCEAPYLGYLQRTRRNVADSDGTLIVCRWPPRADSGTIQTHRFALEIGRPVEVVDLHETQLEIDGRRDCRAEVTRVARIRGFVAALGHQCVLNVAGPRESREPGICEATRRLLVEAFG